jgi:hypothetical protein
MKLFDEILQCPDEQGWTNPNISRTKNIVEIAESFAIEFAEWFFDKNWNKNSLSSSEFKKQLEIYKQTL